MLLIFFNRSKVSVIVFCEICHHILCALGQLPNSCSGGSSVAGKSWNDCLRREDGVVFNHATVFKNASATLKNMKRKLCCSLIRHTG